MKIAYGLTTSGKVYTIYTCKTMYNKHEDIEDILKRNPFEKILGLMKRPYILSDYYMGDDNLFFYGSFFDYEEEFCGFFKIEFYDKKIVLTSYTKNEELLHILKKNLCNIVEKWEKE